MSLDFETVEGEGIDNLGLQGTKFPVTSPKERKNLWVLLLYCTCAIVGTIGGPCLQRLYYMHGGTREWLQSWLQSVGFFVLVPPLSFLYLKNVSGGKKTTSKEFFMDSKLFYSSALIGILIGLDNYMYSAGLSRIPISTSSLLFSTGLAFTALFSFFIVKQKFLFYSVNSVVVMSFGAVVLGLHTSGDRPLGVSKEQYVLGFFFTLGGAALQGLYLPLIELAYTRSTKSINYLMLMQFQFGASLFATLFCTVGMLIKNDSEIIPREAREFGMGERNYYVILVTTAIMWQFSLLGLIGIINNTSSLFAGILASVLLPITEVASVVIFHEKFNSGKGVSLALCLWGFTSYFIGEYKKTSKTTSVEIWSMETFFNKFGFKLTSSSTTQESGLYSDLIPKYLLKV